MHDFPGTGFHSHRVADGFCRLSGFLFRQGEFLLSDGQAIDGKNLLGLIFIQRFLSVLQSLFDDLIGHAALRGNHGWGNGFSSPDFLVL